MRVLDMTLIRAGELSESCTKIQFQMISSGEEKIIGAEPESNPHVLSDNGLLVP
jgi:hypothetical protein